MKRLPEKLVALAALASCVAVVAAVAPGRATPLRSHAALTVTPTQHDYGDVVVGTTTDHHQEFTINLSAGALPSDTVRVTLLSADPQFEVLLDPSYFQLGGSYGLVCGTTCVVTIAFRPTSVGQKSQTAVFMDHRRGGGTGVNLKGKGIAGCLYVVVPCNYGAMYSGTVSMVTNSTSPQVRYVEQVDVTVKNGKAECKGTVSETERGVTANGIIQGPGLFAVEFVRDDAGRLVYEVTAACPSAMGMGSPPTPAELDGREMKSYKQPATGGIGMDLIGTDTQNGDDPTTSLVGSTTVKWSLKVQ